MHTTAFTVEKLILRNLELIGKELKLGRMYFKKRNSKSTIKNIPVKKNNDFPMKTSQKDNIAAQKLVQEHP